ncbi:hypothetical protein PSYMP_19254 [Pseudomonas amygdali pv. morsprunorum str. M302280]|nr:hypothetical protein PSYMP_19254 [Pseudomonas amygdali pv. morsprunorum str. M302280]
MFVSCIASTVLKSCWFCVSELDAMTKFTKPHTGGSDFQKTRFGGFFIDFNFAKN